MIKKVVELDLKTQNAIRQAQYRGKLTTYDIGGYCGFDTEEYEEYKKTAKKGRPLNKKRGVIKYGKFYNH